MACKMTWPENYDENDNLIRIHEEELTKLRKYSLLINALKAIKSHEMSINTSIKEKMNFLKIGDFVEFFDKNNAFLSEKKPCTEAELTYAESKLIQEELVKQLQETYKPVFELKARMCSELSADVFDINDVENISKKKLLDLNSEYRSNLKKLMQLRNRKCELLNQAAEIKSSPLISNELKMFLKELHQNQLKAKVLSGFMKNELPKRSERSLQALREIQIYIENASDVKK